MEKSTLISKQNEIIDSRFQTKLTENYFNFLYKENLNPFLTIVTQKNITEIDEFSKMIIGVIEKQDIKDKELSEYFGDVSAKIMKQIRNKFMSYNQFQLNLFSDKSLIFKAILLFLWEESLNDKIVNLICSLKGNSEKEIKSVNSNKLEIFTKIMQNKKEKLVKDIIEDCLEIATDVKQKQVNNQIENTTIISESIGKIEEKQKIYLKSQYFSSNIVALFHLLSNISLYFLLGFIYLPADIDLKLFISENAKITIRYFIEKKELESVKIVELKEQVNQLHHLENDKEELVINYDNVSDVFEYFHKFLFLQTIEKNNFYCFVKNMNLPESYFLRAMNHYLNGGIDNSIDTIKALSLYKDYQSKMNKLLKDSDNIIDPQKQSELIIEVNENNQKEKPEQNNNKADLKISVDFTQIESEILKFMSINYFNKSICFSDEIVII